MKGKEEGGERRGKEGGMRTRDGVEESGVNLMGGAQHSMFSP